MVRVFWLVNKCVFIVLWRTKMTWAMWFAVSKLWEFTVKVYIRALYIVFLFVKMERNNAIKEIKHVLRAFIACLWRHGEHFSFVKCCSVYGSTTWTIWSKTNLLGRPCQQKARNVSKSGLVGAYIPQCNPDGTYKTNQCHASIGYCWCADPDGGEWPDTRVRGSKPLQCERSKGL